MDKGRGTSMNIMKSSEDYLEMMLMLKEKKGYIRSVDIAAELGVTKPSVSYATKRLRENGYIAMNADGLIELTDAGMTIAKKIYRRHKVIASFLMSIGVEEKVAYEDACKIEHDISPRTFQALNDHLKNNS